MHFDPTLNLWQVPLSMQSQPRVKSKACLSKHASEVIVGKVMPMCPIDPPDGSLCSPLVLIVHGNRWHLQLEWEEMDW